MSLTGAPAAFDSRAARPPSMPGPNFEPKPPPIYSVITRTWFWGNSRCEASPSRTLNTPWVEDQAVTPASVQETVLP